MSSTATWLIVIGFVLLVTGVVLRAVIMMRSSDAAAPGTPLHGRALVSQYRHLFPRSMAPLLTRWLLIGGTVLLLAGLSVEFAH